MFIKLKKFVYSILGINEKNEYKFECLKICLIYFILGFLWIYFSERIVYKHASDTSMLLILNTYKGWLYVIVTTVTLYLLINKLLKKVDSAEKRFSKTNQELTCANEELESYIQQLTASEEELRTQYDQITENEKLLSISEEKNKAIINAIPDLLFVIDSNGYFIDCMASDENLLIAPRDVFIGRTIYEIMPQEIAEIASNKAKSVLMNGTLEVFEYKLEIGGSEQSYEARMVKNGNNEVLVISRNVTLERQKELELKLSEEKYRTLVNKMMQGLALYEGKTDDNVTDYRFLDSNEAHVVLTGLNVKESLGKTVGELLPNLGETSFEKLNYVVKTGQSVHYQHYFQNTDKYYDVIAYRPRPLQLAIIINDITEKKKAEDALKASEYTFRKLFESSSDAILINEGDKILDCNTAMVELLGYDSKEYLVGKYPKMFCPEVQPDGESSYKKIIAMAKRTMLNGKCKFDWWYKKADGTLAPAEIMMTSIILNGKKVIHSLWRDINERKQMEEKLKFLSYHDQLTGLYNRRFFEEALTKLDAEMNLPFTFVMADVNGLKLVNDSFGHDVGDELLKKVAEVMTKGCPSDSIISRLAGDEFMIFLPGTETDEAEQIIKNIKNLASKERVNSVEISISFGYETKTTVEENNMDILRKAEDHMYKKKLFESPSMRGKTINTIITTLHEKNKREEQHSLRVSKLCESMGRAIGLSEDDIGELKTVGLLHDIGKIAIDENILNKPGKLTEEEWDEIKKHPEIGYRILSTSNEMSEMAEYVLAHHEKWNGTGYPKHLKGEEIPLQSRIISIADSYDAMVSERSYRDALPEEVAIHELITNAGTQFDAELVKIFIGKVLDKPID